MYKNQGFALKAGHAACALLLAGTMGAAGLAAVPSAQAYAEPAIAIQADAINIADMGIQNCGDQYNLSPKSNDGSIASAMAYSSSVRDKDRNRLYCGEDYEVAYDWSGIDAATGLGEVTATLTGIGKYNGEVSFTYNVVAYTLTVNGVTGKPLTFTQADLQQWIQESTTNTEPQFYQYGGNGSATVIGVPAKSYLTLDELLVKAGMPESLAGKWKQVRAEAPDGFGFNYTLESESGKWYPAMSAESVNATGATDVPLVFTLSYATSTVRTGTCAQAAAALTQQFTDGTASLDYVPRTFTGITDPDSIGGNRFPTGVSTITLTGEMPFDKITDVEANRWFTSYVENVVNAGYMGAIGGTTEFQPNGTLTRAQAVTVLYRAAVEDQPEASTVKNETPFADNLDGKWYTAAVNWAYKEGITTGNGNTGLFDTASPINRQQLATILARYSKNVLGIDTAVTDASAAEGCTDWSTVAGFAQDAIKWTAANDILSGSTNADGSKSILPFNSTTRAQMAKMISQTMMLGE